MTRNVLLGFGTVAFLAFLAGCNRPAEPANSEGEEEVRQVFSAFQKGLKDRDGDKLWSLLDEDSQADAEREAKGIREAYARADDAAKKEQEKGLGLPGAELAALKGPGFLETRRFLGKHDEVPDSKVDKVEAKGDKGVVNYVEPDGDKEKFTLSKQGGKWKLSVPMPRGVQR